MGTRGAVGFRYNNIDKVTYCHLQSGFSGGLGEQTLIDIAKSSCDSLRETFDRIILVDATTIPTKEQSKECLPFYDADVHSASWWLVPEQTPSDWYLLLRRTQGGLAPWIPWIKPSLTRHGGRSCRYMIDSSKFLLNSLFCEWAYIVNLDEEVFEIYQGYVTEAGTGRYSQVAHTEIDPRKDNTSYYGVELKIAVPLTQILQTDPETFSLVVSNIEAKLII